MVAQNLIKDLLALPVGDRLDLVHRLWDSLLEDPNGLPLDDAQRQELNDRYQEFLAEPSEGSSWDEVEAFVRERLRQ